MTHVLRRLAGFVLLVGGVLLGGHLLGVWQRGPVPVEIHYLLGAQPVATALEVLVTPAGGGPAVARFESHALGPDVEQRTRLPAGPAVLDITLVSAAGERHTVQRTIDAQRDAVVRIDLSSEGLRAR